MHKNYLHANSFMPSELQLYETSALIPILKRKNMSF